MCVYNLARRTISVHCQEAHRHTFSVGLPSENIAEDNNECRGELVSKCLCCNSGRSILGNCILVTLILVGLLNVVCFELSGFTNVRICFLCTCT